MKNIHVLPTDKSSRVYHWKGNNTYESGLRIRRLAGFCDFNSTDTSNQHIYITSDEEIKEGDVVKIPCGVGKVKELNWKFGNNNPSYIVEDIFIYKLRYGQKEGELQINSFRYEDVKKIILTTDQDLIKDGVQAIDDEFLEWFVKNPSCEWVEIITTNEINVLINNHRPYYKIIIPKEEVLLQSSIDGEPIWGEPEQETLNEVALEFAKDHHEMYETSNFGAMHFGFCWGAKWQAERSYSEEEVIDIAKQAFVLGANFGLIGTFNEWFEQFKKK